MLLPLLSGLPCEVLQDVSAWKNENSCGELEGRYGRGDGLSVALRKAHYPEEEVQKTTISGKTFTAL